MRLHEARDAIRAKSWDAAGLQLDEALKTALANERANAEEGEGPKLPTWTSGSTIPHNIDLGADAERLVDKAAKLMPPPPPPEPAESATDEEETTD